MIESVKIQNFQSHKDTYLEFHPGINIITGESDCGKTAIIRGLKWLFHNTPQGTALLSDSVLDKKGSPKEDCFVSAKFDNFSLQRLRGPEFNGYVLDGEKYEALRTDVPDVVFEKLNMDSINLQNQQDPAFLLSNTPGEVARFFNGIVKLEDIDKASSIADSNKRASDKEVKRLEKEFKDLQEKDSLFEKIPQIKDFLNDVKSLESEVTILKSEIQELESIQIACKEAKTIINAYSDLEKLRDSVNLLEADSWEFKEFSRQFNSLSGIVESLQQAERVVLNIHEIPNSSELQNQIESELPAIEREISNLASLVETLEYTEKIVSRYSPVSDILSDVVAYGERLQVKEAKRAQMRSLAELVGDLQTSEKHLQENSEELEKLNSQLPEVCPFCGK